MIKTSILTTISFSDYSTGLIYFFATLVVLLVFKFYITRKLLVLAGKTENKLDDDVAGIVSSIKWPFYLVVPAYIAAQSLALPDSVLEFIFYAFLIVIVYYITKLAQGILTYFISKSAIQNQQDGAIISLVGVVMKIFIWVIAAMLVISNMGYNLTSLVAGLGIGGIAIALAVQNILTDIFSSFSIYFDKPFNVGEVIKVGDDIGTVKVIGLKTTRLTTLQGEELIISNRDLTTARIQNLKRMERRRSVFTLGVTYETPTEKLREIPKIIKNIVDGTKQAEFERAHFKTLGDYSLNFEVSYFVLSSDYLTYMDTLQEINLRLMNEFAKAGIEFAYPTQTILVNKH